MIKRLSILAVLTAMLTFASGASAADFEWSGSGTTKNWSDTGNWVGNTAPEPSSSISTLTFPARLNEAEITNDVSGLSLNTLQIADNQEYNITGTGFTLGAGGLQVNGSDGTPDKLRIATPITLSGSQVWNVEPTTHSVKPNTSHEVLMSGALIGENTDLTINLNTHTLMILGPEGLKLPPVNDELGAVTVNGVEVPGEPTFKSFVVLENANLNATDGHPLNVNDINLQTQGNATGPITATNSVVSPEGASIGPVTALNSQLYLFGKVVTPAVSLDASSALQLILDSHTDGSKTELTSTGTISLGGAALEITTNTDAENGCPSGLPPSDTTLISTTGNLAGAFGNAPNGGTVQVTCEEFNLVTETTTIHTYPYTVSYNTAGSPKTVTISSAGTAETPAPGGPPANPGSGPSAGGGSGTTAGTATTPGTAPSGTTPGVSPKITPKVKPKCKLVHVKVKGSKKTKTKQVCPKAKPKKHKANKKKH